MYDIKQHNHDLCESVSLAYNLETVPEFPHPAAELPIHFFHFPMGKYSLSIKSRSCKDIESQLLR